MTAEAALDAQPGADPGPPLSVSVVLIAYNDVEHIEAAARSALAQGAAVAEVVAVDDASTDGTGAVLDSLAAQEPRLRVVHRASNSGGCGTPRNDGLRTAQGRYVMFLDSDDVLPDGAVDALLRAATRYGTPVTAGACVRRELPGGRETLWRACLYSEPAAPTAPADRPELVHDTLCVNKLYDRAFLLEHRLAFPEGRFTYEDFVFTARVLAAAPRIATIPDEVYVWHVRRSAANPSISLDRESIANWRARLTAHRESVEVFLEAGRKELARAARVKFLDYDLRMYVRELHTRDADYRLAWWRLTREYLSRFDDTELHAARAPARWISRVLLASPDPVDLRRLTQLAARPGRLLPPYARSEEGRPVWSEELPQVELDGLDGEPVRRLPVTIDAEPVIESRCELRLTVHELYGQLTRAEPVSLDVEVRHRDGSRRYPPRTVALTPADAADPAGAPHSGASWRANVLIDLEALADRGARGGRPDSWDLTATVRCADGSHFIASFRAVGRGLRRTVLPSRRHLILLVQPYATTGGAFALRLSRGPRGAWGIAARRLRRKRARAS